jgi:hypothetical protein
MNGGEQIIEQVAWNGRFAPPVLLAGGGVLALAVVVLTWWGTRWTRRTLPWLILLRLAAIGLLVWMLAEPVIRTTVRRTRAKTIVVMADDSASMRVTDPTLDVSQAARWAAAESTAGPSAVVRHLDGARYALMRSRDVLRQLADKNTNKTPANKLSVAQVDRWLDLAGRELAEAPEGVARNVRSSVDEFLRPKCAELLAELSRGAGGTSEAAGGAIEEMAAQLDEAVGELDQAAERSAVELAQSNDTTLRNVVLQQGSTSRQEKISTLLNRLESSELSAAAGKGNVLRYYFDSRVSPSTMKEWRNIEPATDASPATDLGAAIEQARQDADRRQVEAVVILTDGGHNSGTDPLQALAGANGGAVPTYIVPVGSAKPVRDVALHHAQAPRSVIEKDLIRIDAMIDAYECAHESLTIKLLQAGSVVDQQTVVIPSDNWFSPVTFERKAEHLGLQEFQLVVSALPDERVPDNNDARLQVEVTESAIRVLLADELPRWEFRYLRNLFKRDQHIEFTSLLMQPGQATGQAGDKLPEQLKEWARYRVVILGDLSPDVLTPARQAQLKEYVTARGGTLVLIAGAMSMPQAYVRSVLEPLLPVEPIPFRSNLSQGVQIVPTVEGRAAEPIQIGNESAESDQVWSNVPAIYDVSPYCVARQTSHVWLAASTAQGATGADASAAYLCWHQVGNGRVAYLSSPSTYRLRFRHGDRYHHRFWGQLLRWAVAREIGTGSDMVRLITDKMHYQSQEPVQMMLRLTDARGTAVAGGGVTATARRDDQMLATVPMVEDADTPGLYRAVLKELPVGKCRIGVSGTEVDRLTASQKSGKPVETEITVEPPLSLELRDTRCNVALLDKLAVASGGAVVPPTALGMVISGLNMDAEAREEVHTRPLWPQWRYLGLFIGVLSVEWVIRKMVGMV